MDGVQFYYIICVFIGVLYSLMEENDLDRLILLLLRGIVTLPITGRIYGWW